MLRAPSLEAMRWLKIADNSIDYSLGNTTKQALWLPTSREAKYKAKQAVDSFCMRAGDVLQAGVVYAGERVALAVPGFAAVNVVLTCGWLAVVALLNARLRAPAARPAPRSCEEDGSCAVALTYKDVTRLFQVRPGRRFRLKRHDPSLAGGDEFQELTKPELKQRAVSFIEKNIDELAAAQELLYASDVYSVLIVLQAMDAAGKDGTIKHVMSGVNPQGCQVFSFKKPSDEEVDHNFLWRYMRALPERGRIGIFNRSYYEDVLVVRVHPEILTHQKLPPGKRGQKFWEARFDDINRFERHLTPQWDARLEVLSAPVKEGAEETVHGAARQRGEALEVLVRRLERARLLERLPAGIPGHAAAHEHEVGSVVGDPGRP